MEKEIITIFCIVDDLLKAISFEDDFQAKMSTAEIITVAITTGWFFGGNHETGRTFFSEYGYVKNMLSKSQFNRRLHAIDQSVWDQLNMILAQAFKFVNSENEYIVDSFPVPVCHNIRIKRSKIYKKKEEYRGYNASKRQYFYGVKVHMITTKDGQPIEFIIAPGSIHDNKIFKEFNFDLEEGAYLYGDAAYNDYEFENLLAEAANIRLLVSRKSNSKRQHEPYVKAWISHIRKKIETSFSQITKLFPKKIHAVTAKGFELKIKCFILAYSVSCL